MTWPITTTSTTTIIIIANEAECAKSHIAGESENWTELGRGDLEILTENLKMYMSKDPSVLLMEFYPKVII